MSQPCPHSAAGSRGSGGEGGGGKPFPALLSLLPAAKSRENCSFSEPQAQAQHQARIAFEHTSA